MEKIIFLGTAGYHPSEKRQTVCVFMPERGIVLDAGTGMYRLIGRVKSDRLDIFLSHAHLDHVVGLTYLIDIIYKHPELKGVTAYMAYHHKRAIRSHLFHENIFPVDFENEIVRGEFFSVSEANPEHFKVRDVYVDTFPLHHIGGAIGYCLRFPNGKRLAYVTDTSVNFSYAPFIKRVDLLIHECNFADSQKTLADLTTHSVTSEVCKLANRCQVKKLALFHFNPLDDSNDPSHHDIAKEKFSGELIIAQDFTEIEF